MFTVLFFAAARDIAGPEMKIDDSIPLGNLPPLLIQMHPALETILTSCAVCVNLEYYDITEDATFVIKKGDEVGIIPPVSSG